jgi:hypothetical protein
VLHAHVERQLDRMLRAAQLLVELPFDAGQALVVDVGEADDVRGDVATRRSSRWKSSPGMPRRLTSYCWRGVRLRRIHTKLLPEPSLAASSSSPPPSTPASLCAASAASSTWRGLA